jgi:hypothetical protein
MSSERALATGTGFKERSQAVDWAFVRHGLEVAALVTVFAVTTFVPLRSIDALWGDAHVYFRATQAWLGGANPWTSTYAGIPFAAPPPALLLNLPLAPFGEQAAVAFWVVANSLAIGVLFTRLNIPIYWLLFQPIAEGWLAASPDLALAGLALLGGGWLAALVKPYSIPALLGERRRRAVVGGLALAAISLLFLPWAAFLASSDAIADSFKEWGRPISAFGDPVLTALVVIALASLGMRRGLQLATPGLLAAQPHYMVFSLQTIVRSRILAVFMSFSLLHSAALGVIVYAIAEWTRVLIRRARGGTTIRSSPA